MVKIDFNLSILLSTKTNRREFFLAFVYPNLPPTFSSVTLGFCSIQVFFIRDIRAKFFIAKLSKSTDIEQNPNRGISNFRIYGQSFLNKNCHNSITIHDIDTELGTVTKLDKRNTASCDVIYIYTCMWICTL